MNYEHIKFAYGVAYSSSAHGYIGAILITDYKGFPLEFRYTDPIIPTRIQQILYGEGLEKYLKIDVIMDNLVKILENKIQILFVQDDDLLEYKSDNIVIVRVSPTKAPPLSSPGEISSVKPSEYLLQVSRSNNPVRIQFQHNFNCEGELFDSIMKDLTEAGNFMDIHEPIERVYKTLELICRQEV